MSTMLIMMALVGKTWVPQYTVEYPSEAACMAVAAKHPRKWQVNVTPPWAVCVPKVQGEVK
jgi:hypothetical protein